MPFTAHGIYYPLMGDPPDGAGQMHTMADSIEDILDDIVAGGGGYAAADKTYFISPSPTGNDANDGLSPGTPKATIASAVTAAAGAARYFLAPGSYTVATDVVFVGGSHFIGAGQGLTALNYTGSGSMFSQSTAGTRIYRSSFQGLLLDGPGTGGSTIGINLDSITDASLHDVTVTDFNTGVRIGSAVASGSVYNNFRHVTASSCGTGFKIQSDGSNASQFFSCRANACTTGIDITDSNNTLWVGGAIESNTTGLKITATGAALADQTTVMAARWEGNTTAWDITSSNVADTAILYPVTFGTYTITDNGTRTVHWGNIDKTLSMPTVTSLSTGSWRWSRSSSGGSSNPAFVVADTNTGSGTPVTVQAETGRWLGSNFRGTGPGGVLYDVRADGIVKYVSEIKIPFNRTTNYTLVDGSTSAGGDGIVIFNGSSLTATLPDPTVVTVGRMFTIKNKHSTSLTVNSAGSSKTIDGAASVALAQWDNSSYISDGTQWLTL